MKVNPEQILQALADWRGHVPSAAQSLGISDWALRKRMRQLGLRAERFSGSATAATRGEQPDAANLRNPADTTEPQRSPTMREKTDRGIRNWRGELGTPSLSTVRAAPDDEAEPKPAIPAARTKPQPPARLKPDHEDQLTRFRLRLQSLFSVEWTNSDILQWLFREQGEAWFAEKCKEAAAQASRE